MQTIKKTARVIKSFLELEVGSILYYDEKNKQYVYNCEDVEHSESYTVSYTQSVVLPEEVVEDNKDVYFTISTEEPEVDNSVFVKCKVVKAEFISDSIVRIITADKYTADKYTVDIDIDLFNQLFTIIN